MWCCTCELLSESLYTDQPLHGFPGCCAAVSIAFCSSYHTQTARCTRASQGLKDRIKVSAREQDGNAGVAFSPRETSLSVNRYRSEQEQHEASFFQQLETEVKGYSLRLT